MMPKRKLSPVIYKKSKNFKKFLEKSKYKKIKKIISITQLVENSISTSMNKKGSLKIPVTNDECDTTENLQMYNCDGCDDFKVINTKELTITATCDDMNTDAKQIVSNSCYFSVPSDVKNVDCCDDTNNHSNNNSNNKRSKVIDDNNTNVASNELNNESNKQISNNDANTATTSGIVGTNINNNQNHHKLSHKTIDNDGDHVDDDDDDGVDKDNDVVDNFNVDNVKYNKHQKTSTSQTATTLLTTTPYMPHNIKQEYVDSTRLISSSSFSSSLENCENHKIKNCEIHQQPPSLVAHIQSSMQKYQHVTSVSKHKAVVNYDCNSTGCSSRESTTSLTICELASPRCQSRESTASASANNDVRCPSNESNYSANDSHTPEHTPTRTTPPIGLPLPATLAPAAAAALLPPQSAAMAAYFNAAAAAAAQQNHHLLLTNPLAAAASLVQQATQQQQAVHSPNSQHNLTPTPPNTSDMVDTTALDFSTKHSRRNSDADDDANGSEVDDDEDDDHVGDGADAEQNDNEADNMNDNETDDLNSPLDLSVNNGRKRQSDEEEPVIVANRKLARSNDYKSLPASSTWVPPINPYLAAVAAASMSPKTPLTLDWSAKTKIQPNEATKALEKMTEMTRLGGSAKTDRNNSPQKHIITNSTNSATTTSTSSSTTTTSNGRHSAWQSHWLNKGADAVKDVFKCVWCKQSFATLASLTTHMKETQHCGVNVPPSVSSHSQANSGGNQTTQSSHHSRHSTTQSSAAAAAAAVAALNANNTTTSGGSKSDLNMLIKETMPLPRKLVRGQDVWLGKGAEQTRQILKCMWCGQSFRSLAEMTSHMQETQHYTNIISQEQIISWKSTEEKGSRDNSSSGGSSNRGTSNSATNNNNTVAVNNNAAGASPNANSTVSAVLTCKVCDQAFATLKELSNHMVKNNHYKEHMMRTAATVENVPTMIRGRGRQTREKRKKSLPVRKLLEMERAQHDFKAAGLDQALKPLRDFAASTKITCEKCGDKVETALFVDHIRQCIDASLSISPRSHNNNNNNNNNILKSPYTPITTQERLNSPQTPHSRSDGRKTSEGNISPLSTLTTRADILCPLPPDAEKTTSGTSVLNALEQLIEKSFDSRARHSSAYGDNSSGGTPLGSSILKRLGIEDNVDYTKPLMDPQTMQFLRSYSSYPSNRDRSASESSSISERCSSRLESFTPERSHDLSRQPTPRLTPDRHLHNAKESRESMFGVKIKSEPIDNHDVLNDADNIPINEIPKKISVKKEFNIPDDHEDLDVQKLRESDMRLSSLTPSSRAISPTISERSITPKSTSSISDKKSSLLLPETSSLNALSSMFNNLNNMNATAINSSNSNIESNNNNNNNNTCNVVKKTNANPLAALQKLCETTDTPATNTRSTSSSLLTHSASSSSSSTNNTGGAGGGGGNSAGSGGNASMLAFSWACNDAIVTADSIIKCSFCDTPFSSKGAYRHHLSKVHFVKDEPSDMGHLKSPGVLAAFSPKSMTSPKSVTSAKSPATQRLESTPPSSVATTPTINPYDESPQSKFLKYTELAKQLSSKNV